MEAGGGNRTPVTCLEGRSSTIELRPHGLDKYYHAPKNAQFQWPEN